MPRLPRVSGAQAVRALERLGFVVVRQRGSHIIMRRGGSGCVVPNHREITSLSGVGSILRTRQLLTCHPGDADMWLGQVSSG